MFDARRGVVCQRDLHGTGKRADVWPDVFDDGEVSRLNEAVGVEECVFPVFFAEMGVEVGAVTNPKSHGAYVFLGRRFFERFGGLDEFVKGG